MGDGENIRLSQMADCTTRFLHILQQNGIEDAYTLFDKVGTPGKKRCLVAFAGQRSAGKSTMINALLCKKLLQTGVAGETAVPVTVTRSEGERAVLLKSGQSESSLVVTLEEFHRRCRLPTDRKNNPFLGSSARIVDPDAWEEADFFDLPGISGEDDTRLPLEADYIIWISSSNHVMDALDKKLLCGLRNEWDQGRLFLVINMLSATENDPKTLRARAEHVLRGCFQGSNFSQLFAERVYCINALEQECAATGTPLTMRLGSRILQEYIEPQELSASEMPAFEEALYHAVCSKTACYMHCWTLLDRMREIERCCEEAFIEEESSFDRQTDLTADADRLPGEIDAQQAMIRHIEEILIQFVLSLKNQLGADYDEFVRSLDTNWDAHFASVETRFSAVDQARIAGLQLKYGLRQLRAPGQKLSEEDAEAKEEEFQALTLPIQKAITQYIDDKLWAMRKQCELHCDPIIFEYELKLENAAANFTHVNVDDLSIESILRRLIAKKTDKIQPIGQIKPGRLLLSFLVFQSDLMTYDMLFAPENSQEDFLADGIYRKLYAAGVKIVILSFTGGPLSFFLVNSMRKLVLLEDRADELEKRLFSQTGPVVVKEFRKKREEYLAQFETELMERMKDISSLLNENAQRAVAEKTSRLEAASSALAEAARYAELVKQTHRQAMEQLRSAREQYERLLNALMEENE